MKQKDWMIRAEKTFVQSFLGIAIPELCIMLNSDLPKSVDSLIAILVPVGCSALAAGISAAWNIINEHLNKES